MLKNINSINFFSMKENYDSSKEKFETLKVSKILSINHLFYMFFIISFSILLTLNLNLKNNLLSQNIEFTQWGTYQHYERMKGTSFHNSNKKSKAILSENNFKKSKRISEKTVFPQYLDIVKNANENANILSDSFIFLSFLIFITSALKTIYNNDKRKSLFTVRFFTLFFIFSLVLINSKGSNEIFESIGENIYYLDFVNVFIKIYLLILVILLISTYSTAFYDKINLFCFVSEKRLSQLFKHCEYEEKALKQEINKLKANKKQLEEINKYYIINKDAEEQIKIELLFDTLKNHKDIFDSKEKIKKYYKNLSIISDL